MRHLLDSHVLLWTFTDRKRLTQRALSLIEDDANELFASMVSLWELSLKVAKGKLELPGDSVQVLFDQIERTRMTLLPISQRHIIRSEKLPPHHGDPFERLLVAQAIEEDLVLLSADTKMPLYLPQVI